MRNKIKILNILTNINDGGLEIIVYRIYNGLDKEKYDLNICTLTKSVEGFLLNQFREVTNSIYEFDFINKKPDTKGVLKNLSNLFKLAKLIRKGKYDIVHSHDVFSSLFTRSAIIINKFIFFSKPKKIFVTYHNIYYWLKPIHRKVNKLLSFLTDKIICVSNSVKNDSVKNEKIKNDKYLVIYNGIEISHYYYSIDIRRESRNRLGYTDRDFVIGNVGVLSERKGQIYIVNAFNLLKEKHSSVKLLFVGSMREHEIQYYYQLMEIIDKSKYKEDIIILDTTKEINRLYNAMDVFVMSSITEGFGLAVYEAMLAERLCIFSDIPVFKEMIKEKETGLFFENKNSKSLYNVLDDVVSNYKNYEKIAKNGMDFTKDSFSVNKMVNQYNTLYNLTRQSRKL